MEIQSKSKKQAYHQSNLIFINVDKELWIEPSISYFESYAKIKSADQARKVCQQLRRKTLLADLDLTRQEMWVCGEYFIYRLKDKQTGKYVYKFVGLQSRNSFLIKLKSRRQDVKEVDREDIKQKEEANEYLKSFIRRKAHTFKKKDKDFGFVEITIVFSNSLEIYEILPETMQYKLSHYCDNISMGLPLLLNLLASSSGGHSHTVGKNRLRSITCPEYILSEYHQNESRRSSRIADCHLYEGEGSDQVTLLILIHSDGELMVYRKHLNFQNEIGYIFKRVVLPLNIVKHFKRTVDSSERTQDNAMMDAQGEMINKSEIGITTAINNPTKNKITKESQIECLGQGILRISNVILFKGHFLEHNAACTCYFQMDSNLWTIEKERIKMVDIRVLGGSAEPIFKPHRSNLPKSFRDFDSKDEKQQQGQSHLQIPKAVEPSQKLSEVIRVMDSFIVTPVRTMMRKELMGMQNAGSEYLVTYSKAGFEVISQKDYKSVWLCNSLSGQSDGQRKEAIINVRAYGHFVAVSYYDYLAVGYQDSPEDSLLGQTGSSGFFKSIKFKFRIYSILSKSRVAELVDKADEPIMHIEAMTGDRWLLATSSTLYAYQLRGDKAVELVKPRKFSSRFALSQLAYVPEISTPESNKAGYMLFGSRYGGLSFHVSKLMANERIQEQWYERLRCQVRCLHLFNYGELFKALLTDEDGNLIVIDIQPRQANKLADFNAGSLANSLHSKPQQQRIVYACFQDGTIKTISAIKLHNPEVSFLDFQDDFYKEIPLIGGFNTQTHTLLDQKRRTYSYVSRGDMLDCRVLRDFFSMTVSLQHYICQKAQLRVDELKAILRSL